MDYLYLSLSTGMPTSIDEGFCLFVWDFSSHSRFLHSYRDVAVAGEGLQILTYARSLNIEGSLACHTYSDTGHPFIMVISEDP